jgi:hypothetical protein
MFKLRDEIKKKRKQSRLSTTMEEKNLESNVEAGRQK